VSNRPVRPVAAACALLLAAGTAAGALIVFENNGEVLHTRPGGGTSVSITGAVNTYDNSVYCYAPTWSPDGRRLAFCRTLIRPDTTPDGRPGPAVCDCYVVTTGPDGGNETRLTRLPPHRGADRYCAIDRLEWSADGRQLGFRWRESANPGAELYCIVNADGSGLEQLTAEEFGARFEPRRRLFSDLSPDGRSRLSVEAAEGVDELFISAADGTGRRRLTRTGGRLGPISGAWSPDGRRIIFIPATEPGQGAVHVIRPDGTGQKQLGRRPVPLSELPNAWSPDRTQLAWSEAGYLFVTDFSSAPRRIAVGTNPDWQPGR